MGSGPTSPVLDLHPLCTLFPRLIGAEFASLKADIAEHGLREPIVVHNGFILDGGNRYRACIEAGVEPTLKEFTGDSAVSFVLSANLHRRHLTPGQQAAIVASAQDWATAQPVGNPAFKRIASQSGNVAGLATVADRAAQSGASERTQRMADSVARQSPDLARQVAHGEISLPKALEQLAPPRSPAARKTAPVGAPAAPTAASDTPRAPSLVEQVIEQQAAALSAEADQDAEEPDAEADPFDQLLADFRALELERDELRAKNAALEQHVALLTKDDLAAQVDGLVKRADAAELKFDQLAGRNRQLQQTARDAQTTAQYQADLLAKIRAALGVEDNRGVLPAITARRAA